MSGKAPYLFKSCPECGGELSYFASFDDVGGFCCECEDCKTSYRHATQLELMDKIASLNQRREPSLSEDDLAIALTGAIE